MMTGASGMACCATARVSVARLSCGTDMRRSGAARPARDERPVTKFRVGDPASGAPQAEVARARRRDERALPSVRAHSAPGLSRDYPIGGRSAVHQPFVWRWARRPVLPHGAAAVASRYGHPHDVPPPSSPHSRLRGLRRKRAWPCRRGRPPARTARAAAP